mmetsp:Transcript_93780/g.165920  ORF Transcript_93780/g.165920 Transcript_93780/m.165920 type:complete len:332 (+) Transcript_93780:220-1215(+)
MPVIVVGLPCPFAEVWHHQRGGFMPDVALVTIKVKIVFLIVSDIPELVCAIVQPALLRHMPPDGITLSLRQLWVELILAGALLLIRSSSRHIDIQNWWWPIKIFHLLLLCLRRIKIIRLSTACRALRCRCRALKRGLADTRHQRGYDLCLGFWKSLAWPPQAMPQHRSKDLVRQLRFSQHAEAKLADLQRPHHGLSRLSSATNEVVEPDRWRCHAGLSLHPVHPMLRDLATLSFAILQRVDRPTHPTMSSLALMKQLLKVTKLQVFFDLAELGVNAAFDLSINHIKSQFKVMLHVFLHDDGLTIMRLPCEFVADLDGLRQLRKRISKALGT